jgi:hypothetical protein
MSLHVVFVILQEMTAVTATGEGEALEGEVAGEVLEGV